jgi:hypothetical protein
MFFFGIVVRAKISKPMLEKQPTTHGLSLLTHGKSNVVFQTQTEIMQ